MRYMIFLYSEYYPEGGIRDFVQYTDGVPEIPESDGWEFEWCRQDGILFDGQHFEVYDTEEQKLVLSVSLIDREITNNIPNS